MSDAAVTAGGSPLDPSRAMGSLPRTKPGMKGVPKMLDLSKIRTAAVTAGASPLDPNWDRCHAQSLAGMKGGPRCLIWQTSEGSGLIIIRQINHLGDALHPRLCAWQRFHRPGGVQRAGARCHICVGYGWEVGSVFPSRGLFFRGCCRSPDEASGMVLLPLYRQQAFSHPRDALLVPPVLYSKITV